MHCFNAITAFLTPKTQFNHDYSFNASYLYSRWWISNYKKIQVEGSLLYKGKGGIGKVFVGWRISGGNEPTAGASILVGMGTSYYGSFVATETEDQCCFLRRSSTWHIVIYGPFASPANLDLVENQRQSSSGEFSRIEKRNGATKITFHSKSMPRGCNDKKYDLFRTMSGKLERQISNLRGKPIDTSLQDKEITESLTAERFLEALQGPELETLKEMEKIVLPEDKTWPFLLRFPVTSFGMCLGVSSQAIMWKTLATTKAEKFLHLTQVVNHVLWWISLVLLVSFSITYLFKTIFFFEAVRREFKHPIRVNFFFAPLISVLFLALGIPHSITSSLPSILWYFFMAPILLLEMKIYGQWMSGGQRRLSKVANPTNHLSIVGNFAGALLGASLGLKEGPMFFFSVGLAYYLVLFVTLYQRLPTNETLPKELHPVFFLFVAAPAVASMAWTTISASFDIGSRIAYFISLFLYFSLVVRINFFRGFKFSLAWWAYTFPMTAVATATIKYSGEVNGLATQILAVLLSGAATLTVIGVLVLTVVHAFVKRDLFPNDFAIAISAEQPKQKKWLKQLINGSLENSTRGLKVLDPEDTRIDIEAPPLSNAVCHTV